VVVTSPTDADTWTVGETGSITWDVFGKVDTVKITYSRDSGSNYLATPLIASTDADNVSSYSGSWDWVIPTDPAAGDFIPKFEDGDYAKIMVEDTTSFGTYVYDESLNFKLKGTLAFTAATLTTLSNELVAGSSPTLTWTREGRISNVNVKYATDGTNFTNSVVSDLAFLDPVNDTQRSTNWSVPETPIGINYKLLVEDANYLYANGGPNHITDAFKVKGQITVTQPATPDTWSIGDTKRIKWNIDHGNIQYVKIYASPSGTFSGDLYLIDPGNLQADNEVLFNAGNTPVAKGYYDWYIPDTTEINASTKLRVFDYNTTDFPDILDDSETITIQGKLTVTTPASDWQVGDTAHDIQWHAYGDVPRVWIDFWNGTSWVNVTDPNPTTGGVASGNGDKSFEVSGWYNEGAVPDTKSHLCKIRVQDHPSTPTLTVQSNTFSVYPVISGVDITESPGDEGSSPKIWRAGLTNQSMSWTETSSKITSVNILYTTTPSRPARLTQP
jgi:hypothetical protein